MRAAPAGLLVALALASFAFAAAPAAAAGPGKPAPAPPQPPKVAITAALGERGIDVKVTNEGATPLEVLAQRSLVSIEITPAAPVAGKGPKGAVRCALSDVGPDREHALVVPPGRSFTMTVDPAFLCFGAKERAAWDAGGSVAVRLGFAGRAGAGPYVVVGAGSADPAVASVKELRAAPFDKPARTTADPAAPAAPALPPLPRDLSIAGPDRIDSSRGVEVSFLATIANETHASITTYARTPTVGVRVEGPRGAVSCAPSLMLAPARELFSTLGPKGRTQVGFLVDAACPAGTFDHPGVYRLVPVLDTRKASGAPLGMRTFDDVVWGTRATELRVRAGRRPDRRVALDPAS